MGNPERYSSGRTVAELVESQRLPPNIATYILIECAKALKDASDQGRLHQNVKPNHIMVSSSGRVQLMKFADESSKSSTSSILKSAMPYVAPEHHEGASPSVSTDIFALGACFYEMLVGEPAFKGASGQEIKQKVLKYDPTPQLHEEDNVHTQLRRICQQMLRKKPQQRYQGYKVLLADLDAYKKNRGVEAVGSALEMKRYFSNPGGYVSPERGGASRERATVRSRPASDKSASSTKKASKTSEKKQPQLSKMFLMVGLVVVLFSGLSIAGNFFFSKDGQWGGRGAPSSAKPSSSSTSSTVTTRRGKGKGNAAVQASGSSDVPQNSSSATVQGESDPVEIIDESNEEATAEEETPVLEATTLAGVDTVIILPNEDDKRTGQLIVKSDPDAYVYFEGDSLGRTPLPIVTNPGTYKVVLKSPRFPVFETLVDVIPNRETPLEVSLWILVGRVELEVTSGAEVFIDEEPVGNSNSDDPIPVLAGIHRLKLVHPVHGIFESDFEVNAGEQKVLRYDLANLQ